MKTGYRVSNKDFTVSDVLKLSHSVRLISGDIFINLNDGVFIGQKDHDYKVELRHIYKYIKTVQDSNGKVLARRKIESLDYIELFIKSRKSNLPV